MDGHRDKRRPGEKSAARSWLAEWYWYILWQMVLVLGGTEEWTCACLPLSELLEGTVQHGQLGQVLDGSCVTPRRPLIP